jgi:hypothetical protein
MLLCNFMIVLFISTSCSIAISPLKLADSIFSDIQKEGENLTKTVNALINEQLDFAIKNNLLNNKIIWNNIQKLSHLSNVFNDNELKFDHSSMFAFKKSTNKWHTPTDLIPVQIVDTTNTNIPDKIVTNYSGDHLLLVEGDMVMSRKSEIVSKYIEPMTTKKKKKKQRRFKRKIIKKFSYLDATTRWPLKLIPFEFDIGMMAADDSFKKRIYSAIDHWEKNTCLKFEHYQREKHKNTHKAKLVFVKSETGCISNIGYPNTHFEENSQVIVTSIFLSKTCMYGQIIHEIGHIIGFFHEQSRGDRDNFIKIQWENIMDPENYNANFVSASNFIEPDNLGIPYDINSIMHYQPTAFSANGNKTIIAKDRNLEFLMGNRVALSFYDKKMVNKAYMCDENCINQSKVCKNDGFMNQNCTCICPTGIWGEFCEKFVSKKVEAAKLETLKLNCTFQIDLCDWIQERYRDEVDYVRNSGKSLLGHYRENVGIIADRFKEPGELN